MGTCHPQMGFHTRSPPESPSGAVNSGGAPGTPKPTTWAFLLCLFFLLFLLDSKKDNRPPVLRAGAQCMCTAHAVHTGEGCGQDLSNKPPPTFHGVLPPPNRALNGTGGARPICGTPHPSLQALTASESSRGPSLLNIPPRVPGQQALSQRDKGIGVPDPQSIQGKGTGGTRGPEPEPRVQPGVGMVSPGMDRAAQEGRGGPISGPSYPR